LIGELKSATGAAFSTGAALGNAVSGSALSGRDEIVVQAITAKPSDRQRQR